MTASYGSSNRIESVKMDVFIRTIQKSAQGIEWKPILIVCQAHEMRGICQFQDS